MRLESLSFFRRFWEGAPVPVQEAIPLALIVEPEDEIERRVTLRHPCHREAWLQPVSLVKSGPWHAIVLDISTSGIGLVLERPIPPGTFLAIDLPDSLNGVSRTIRGRVAYLRPESQNYWHIGCALDGTLNSMELEALLS